MQKLEETFNKIIVSRLFIFVMHIIIIKSVDVTFVGFFTDIFLDKPVSGVLIIICFMGARK